MIPMPSMAPLSLFAGLVAPGPLFQVIISSQFQNESNVHESLLDLASIANEAAFEDLPGDSMPSVYGVCLPPECPALPALPNGKFVCNGTRLEDDCIVACDPGFKPADSTRVKCGGQVTPTTCQTPVFVVSDSVPSTRITEEVSSPLLSFPLHFLPFITLQSRSTGVTASLNWSSYPSTSAHSRLPSCVPARCPALAPPLGLVLNCTATGTEEAGYGYATTCQQSCQEGFERVGGDSVRHCMGGGVWSGAAMVCERVQCPLPELAPHR